MTRVLSLGLLLLSAFAAAAQAEEASDPNAVYERFVDAMAAMDADSIAQTVYHEDATYLRMRDESFAVGRSAIQDSYAAMFTALEGGGLAPELAFRLQSRVTGSDLITDAGWFRLTLRDDAGAAVDTHYGRFLVVLAQMEDGSWAFLRDLDSPAVEALWQAQEPVEGLYYEE